MIVLRNTYVPPRELGERIAPNTTPPATRAPLLKRGGDSKRKRAARCLGPPPRTNSAPFSCFAASPLFSLAELADGCELRGEGRELGFDGGDFLLVLGAAPRLLGGL